MPAWQHIQAPGDRVSRAGDCLSQKRHIQPTFSLLAIDAAQGDKTWNAAQKQDRSHRYGVSFLDKSQHESHQKDGIRKVILLCLVYHRS